ncbi:YybH family protein [Nocardioides daejeonensis]|uniref:YybH family protein n=1 Tax=Nocardioides daejeonensis TaxID=1046556 RepID=UPI000D747F53|nr:nuclear transport factor 2 family protein [Nocardioides daejeonensis]
MNDLPDTEQSAVAAVSLAWKAAYNARDVEAVAALYNDDAVLSVPGMPHLQGRGAIADFFRARIELAAGADLRVEDVPLGPVVVSGDLAWQWQTFEMVHGTKGVVGNGALCTLFRRVSGSWLIAGDISNLAEPRVDLYAHVAALP